MVNFPSIDSSLSWFAAFPDSGAGAMLAGALRQRVPDLESTSHGSGRPWLVGRWADGEAVVAGVGDRRLAILGEHRLTSRDLSRLCAAADNVRQLKTALRQQPGSFHLAVSNASGMEVTGTLSGLRRVYFGQLDDVTVVSDRADVVAALIGSTVDVERLATRLLAPYAPWPLCWAPAWRDVTAVLPHEGLAVSPGSGPRTFTRWSPPAAELSLADAGLMLREALTDAVQVRLAAGGVVSSDLSGMDSTALCRLAADAGARLVALTCVSPDPLDDDLPWAIRAVRGLAGVTHEVLPVERNPLPYEDLLDLQDRFDEPTVAVMHRASFVAVSARAAAHGARLRFNGFGGDELLTADAALQRTLFRSHPRTALRHLRMLRTAYRWPRGETLSALLDRRGYGAWMAGLAGDLRTSWPSSTRPMLGWGAPPGLAPWVSADAVALLRRILSEEAERATALTDDGGTHARLVGLYAGAAMARHLAQMTRRVGVPAAMPYFDDQVIEAALAARLSETTDPRQYKPLIREAMRGIVPDDLLARNTKADTSIAAARGAQLHRDQLLALAENSHLAELGLIDLAAMRAAMRSPDERTWYELDQTLACETWLRTVAAAPVRL
jgi:asparagine synthase (glutamine-hydrolysing)